MRSSTPLARSSGSCLCPTQPSSGRGLYSIHPRRIPPNRKGTSLTSGRILLRHANSTTPALHWPTFAPALTVRFGARSEGRSADGNRRPAGKRKNAGEFHTQCLAWGQRHEQYQRNGGDRIGKDRPLFKRGEPLLKCWAHSARRALPTCAARPRSSGATASSRRRGTSALSALTVHRRGRRDLHPEAGQSDPAQADRPGRCQGRAAGHRGPGAAVRAACRLLVPGEQVPDDSRHLKKFGFDRTGINEVVGVFADCEGSEPEGEVCPAWALDWRCKSSTGRVGSNREPKATARSMVRRETRDAGAARPCGEEARGEPQHRTRVNSWTGQSSRVSVPSNATPKIQPRLGR